MKLKEINGKYYNKCKVHLLYAKTSPIIREDDGIIHFDEIMNSYGGVDHFHIHVTSNEEIKKGDVIIDGDGDIQVVTDINIISGVARGIKNHPFILDGSIKVIASTNESSGLSKPSKQFIKKYITEYNRGNIITDVLVEFDLFKSYSGNEGLIETHSLKTDSHNNIVIKAIKETWNREEVELLICRCITDIYEGETKPTLINKWIKQNL